MLTWPKPSSTPSRARMRLAMTSSWRAGRSSGMDSTLERRQHLAGKAAHLPQLIARADDQLEQPHALLHVTAEPLGDDLARAGHGPAVDQIVRHGRAVEVVQVLPDLIPSRSAVVVDVHEAVEGQDERLAAPLRRARREHAVSHRWVPLGGELDRDPPIAQASGVLDRARQPLAGALLRPQVMDGAAEH